MIVQDIIDAANTSELVNILNKIDSTKNTILINWINQSMIAIAKHIPLLDKEKVYALVTDAIIGTDTYELPADCLRVMSVYDELGNELSINDESDPKSVFTPSFNRLIVPGSVIGGYVSVIYSAKPETLDNVTQLMPVNEVFLEPILNFISAKAHKSLDTNDSTRLMSATYMKNFHQEIGLILNSGMHNTDGIKEEATFKRGGWK